MNGASLEIYYQAATREIEWRAGTPNGKMIFSLLNSRGQNVFNGNIEIQSSGGKISIPENLSSGIYFVVIQDKNRILPSRKIAVH